MTIATLKARFESIKARALKASGQNWRDYRTNELRASSAVYNPPFAAHGENNLRWVENTDKAGLRLKGYVNEPWSRETFSSKPSLGWYADSFYDSTYYPVVYQLPARNGKPRFVYGYADPNNKGAALLSFDACDNEDDAQRWACSVAKSFAEDAREEDAKFQAEQQIESERESITEGRKEFLALCSEIRRACKTLADFPAMRAAMEGRLREIVSDRTRAFKRIAKLTAEPWIAVEN